MADDGWQKGTVAGNDRVNDYTTTLGTNKSGWQQWSRRGATTLNQVAAPVLRRVGLMPVSSFSGEEGVENVAPREIDFQTEDGGN